jgi:hypothetical protein
VQKNEPDGTVCGASPAIEPAILFYVV